MATKMKKESGTSNAGMKTSEEASPAGKEESLQNITSTEEKLNPPLRTLRLDEKNALVGLNNRFAAIIEKNHQLEHANNKLTKEVHKAEENLSLTVTRLQTTFGKELEDYRKKFDDSEKSTAKLTFSDTQHKKDLVDLKKKLGKANDNAAALKKQLEESDQLVTKLTTENKEYTTKIANLDKEKKDLEEDKFRLAQDLSDTRCKFEEETMAKIELQNQLKHKIEENNVKSQLFEQEILQVNKIRQVEVEAADEKAQKNYELKMQEAVKELRTEAEKELDKNKNDQQNLFNKKESDLVSQINALKDDVAGKTKELDSLRGQLDDAAAKSAALDGEKHALVINLKNVEKKAKQDKDRLTKEKKKKDDENTGLRKEKDALIVECCDLLETKVALDNEIATYRVLLEGEEQRLNLTTEIPKIDENKNLVTA